MDVLRCPTCAATAPTGAVWCSLCYGSLAADDDPPRSDVPIPAGLPPAMPPAPPFPPSGPLAVAASVPFRTPRARAAVMAGGVAVLTPLFLAVLWLFGTLVVTG